MRGDRRAPLLAGLALILATAGCQGGGVSMEEVRRLTAQAVEAPVVAPPESIDDVLAVLAEGPAPEWRPRVARDRALAGQAEPGETARPDERINFLYSRGLARVDVGLVVPALDDLARSVEMAKRSPGAATERVLHALAHAHDLGGSASEGARRRIESMATAQPPPVAGRNAMLAVFFARRDDGQAAAAHAARGQAMLPESETLMAVSFNQAFLPPLRAMVARGAGAVARMRGEHDAAHAFYRHALAELAVSLRRKEQAEYMSFANVEDIKPYVKWAVHVDAAANLVAAGRLDEAEAQARDAIRTAVSRYGSDAPHVATALASLGDVLLEQGRADDADRVAEVAGAVLGRARTRPEALVRAQTARVRAAALLVRGRGGEAAAAFARLGEEMAADGELRDAVFDRDVEWALALIRAGRAAEAAARLDRALGRMALPPADHVRAEVRAALGAARAAAGDPARALADFRAAVPVLIAWTPRGDGRALVSLREWRRQELLEAYVDLLARIRGGALAAGGGGDPAAEGFHLADAARGRSVQRALGAGAARTAAARDPALLELVERERAIETQVAALHRTLAELAIRPRKAKDDPRPTPEAAQAQVEGLTRARAGMADEIRRRFPGYAEMMEPRPATIAQARQALREDEAMIAILVGRERAHVWALSATGEVAAASAPLTREELTGLVARVRRSVTPFPGTPAEQPVFDADAAHRLYAALLQPVEAGWRGARRLVVVPHGPLGQLPFALLLTAPALRGPGAALPFAEHRALPFLVRQASVVQLPSVASAAILATVPAPPAGRRALIGFGDPWFSTEQARRAEADPAGTAPAGLSVRSAAAGRAAGGARLADLDRLPDTAGEVVALAGALGADPARDVHVGRRANEAAVRAADLAAYQVVAFATHGLVPGALAGLGQPALALTAPEVAGVAGDGLLTMEEILGLRLNADWVVLSACDTAAGAGAGAEAVSGLGRAFFYAGTRAVLVTHWPVETTSARVLTTELFRRLAADAALARADALRQAQLHLLDAGTARDAAGRAEFAYAHPMFWAPFALVGDGRR